MSDLVKKKPDLMLLSMKDVEDEIVKKCWSITQPNVEIFDKLKKKMKIEEAEYEETNNHKCWTDYSDCNHRV